MPPMGLGTQLPGRLNRLGDRITNRIRRRARFDKSSEPMASQSSSSDKPPTYVEIPSTPPASPPTLEAALSHDVLPPKYSPILITPPTSSKSADSQSSAFAHSFAINSTEPPSFDVSTAPGSIQNPIDLTETPSASSPEIISLGLDQMEIDQDFLANEELARKLQLEEDEAVVQMSIDADYARALQQQLDEEQHIESGADFVDPSTVREQDEMLRGFGKTIVSQRCTRCRRSFLPDGKLLVAHASDLVSRALSSRSTTQSSQSSSGSELLHPYARCRICATCACMGCGNTAQPATLSVAPRLATDEFSLGYCCKEGHLFLIWLLLCGPTYRALEKQPANGPVTRSKGKAAAQKAAAPPPPPPTSAALPSGVGYGGSSSSSTSQLAKAIVTPVRNVIASGSNGSAMTAKDYDMLGAFFQALSEILPSYDRGRDWDRFPSPLIMHMLKRSPLLGSVAELLRSDSIGDITPRFKLYENLLNFLKVVAAHTCTAPAVFGPRLDFAPERILVHVSTVDCPPQARSPQEDDPDALQPISSLVKGLGRQARQLIQHSMLTAEEFRNESGQKTLELCQNICETANFFEANLRGDIVMGGTALDEERNVEELRKWHFENAVSEVADEELLRTFYFATEATNLAATAVKPGRMKKLIAEISNMTQSLPDGVYVRHGSSRLDVMKILITGPKGTPYEDGLFEFDLFCPANYPEAPPRMQFKTTGGVTPVRFNPNLYEDGKVCLSLLGTWQGEPWRPTQSTLLQVFVSIQSMVFCDEPWYNEPGREAAPNAAASQKYNKTIRSYTIPHAMNSWLAGGDHVWTDVVDRHFRAKASTIRRLVEAWNLEGNELDGVASTLEAHLTRFSA